MARISEDTSATKLIETSFNQSVLDRMYHTPEIVDAMLIDEDGNVLVYLSDENEPRVVGRMMDIYSKHFGKTNVRSWKVTGGHPLDELQQVGTSGEVVTPKAFYGLNIHFSTK